MYKAILVDDEPWALNGLKTIIDWQQYGFEISGTYANGLYALKELDKIRPDVIFTDIKMPKMSGVELISQSQKIIPEIESVIISAYGDFKVAQKAIEYGAIGYILKPLNQEDIVAVLKKIKTKLDSKRENSNLLIDLQNKTEVLEVAKKLSTRPLKNYHCVIIAGETEELSFEREVVCYPLEIKHFPKKAYVCSSNNVLNGNAKFYSSLFHREIEELWEMIQEAIFAFKGNFQYSSNQIVSRMQVYLSENYRTNISLKHLSAIFFLSETYLCDIFKKETQDTIFNFIKKIRIHNACYLMKYSNLSLKEISIAVGFNDYSYFGRAFKQITQESPAAYKGKFDNSISN